ncbi:LysR family transcriptional regulator [Histidinibacterium lentulum]|uniref:LysR family transcriptional regulator n=1 Tax=Histidinibacterium lentulum TaxID=2480588 RepID=A0A3N2R162_9RHOB|nr:LysR family transcriptional regulator [Histidinibacterium lentulum]ROU01207.1 LysR family transcriptional regulator [Histidinibacterium lentulum]
MNNSTDPLPPLPCLRAFLAVADCGGFTRAADRLALTQTAVSHQIARLETHVGARLFHRGRSGVTLTPAGARMRPWIEEGLAALHRGLGAAGASGGETPVTIATTPEFGARWLAPRLPRLMREIPGIRIALSLGYGRDALATGAADLAVWLGPGGPGTETTPLGVEEEFSVCSPALASRLPAMQAFLAAPMLRYAGARHTVLDWERYYALVRTARYGTPPDFESFDLGPVFEDFDTMIAACKRGEGFALVRTSLVLDDLAAGSLVSPFEEIVTSDLRYHAVVPAGPGSPEIIRIRDWLVATSHAGNKPLPRPAPLTP